MDVRLPNGQIITNVPDSITQQQLAQIAIANNLAREEDFAEFFDPPEDDTTLLGATGEFFKGIPRGVANSLISTGEGLFQLADAGLNLVGLEDAIDQEDEDVVLGLAKQGRDAVNESFLGADEAYRDSFGTKFGEGLGSFLTFLGPGLLGKAAGLTGKGMAAARYGGAGTLAVGAGAGDQSQRIQFAREQGIDVSGDQEDLAIGLGGAIGLTELAPVEKLLKGLPRELPDGFKDRSIAMLKKALGTGSVEAVQEGVAGVLQDAVALGVYDPNQKVGESLWDDLTVGGAVGTTADLIVTYAAGRRKRSIDQSLLETEKDIRERIEAEEQKRREQSSQKKLDPSALYQDETAPTDEEPDVINVQPATVPFTTPSQAGERFPDRKRVPVGTPTLVEGEKFAGGNPYAATAIEISRRLGDSFPLNETFTVAATATSAEGPVRQRTAVFDSQGKQYGPEYADPREAIQLAGALNGQVLEQTLEQNNALVIDEAGLDLDEDQRQTMLTLGRRVLGTDTNSYHKSAIDYAAGTTAENGYADDLTAQQAIDEGIRPKDMTASQRINAARLKKGLPETNNFSLSEARKALGDNVGRLAEFESGASEVDTLRAFSQDGVPAVSVDRDGVSTGVIKTRPTTAAEKEAARSQGKRAPGRVKFTSMRDAQEYAGFINQRKGGAFVSSAEMFGEMELSQEKFAELLAAKNIDMDYNSPEMRKLAQILTGRKLRRDQSINDLKNEELQFLYHKMRAFPRFNKPTKLPVFELKPYSPAELQLAVDHLRQQGTDISRAALEYQGKTMKARAYDQVIKKAREVVSRDQAAVEEASQPEQTPQILALPSPDQRRTAMSEAIAARVKKLGLSDDFITRLVDRVRTPNRDAQGNIDFVESADPRQAAARGAFEPIQRVLQVSFDNILAEAGPNATDAELLVRILGTLNHEVLHALRVLDLITEQEMATLEKAARAYAPDGAQGYEAGETFFQYAERVYSNLDPASRMEEAIAELIKYGYQNNLIDDRGKAVKLGGKPRGIITKIVDFLKEMVGFSRGTGARSFNDFLQALESGEVGARARGEIRTPVMLDKIASKQGITREEAARKVRGELRGEPPQTRAQEGEEREPEFRQTTPDEPELAFDRSVPDFAKRDPELSEAADMLKKGEITREEYSALVDERRPVRPYEDVPNPATAARARRALTDGKGQSPEKAAKYGKPQELLKKGEPAQLRLDIPSYTLSDTWVVSVHYPDSAKKRREKKDFDAQKVKAGELSLAEYMDNKTAESLFTAGEVVGYQSVAALTNAKFGMSQRAAQAISIDKPKGTIATIMGGWNPMGPRKAKELAEKALESKDWIQVGMDPYRHSYFYNRSNPNKRVISADEVIQVGPLVLAKNAVEVDAFDDAAVASFGVQPTVFDVGPAQESVDIIDIVSGREQPPPLKGKKQVAGYLQRRTLERLGVPRDITREEDREAIAEDLSREAVYEYENVQESAVEWYNETIDKTIEMLGELYPEIKTDSNARTAFLLSLAITSQNMAVPDNLALAEKAYKFYRDNGRFKEEGSGDKKKSMKANFVKANKLLKKMSMSEIEQFLKTEFIVRDLNEASAKLLGKQADTGENVDNRVFGSAIFGPKIGQGFFTNLRGDYRPVTMDMWFMRTIGRLSGTLTGTSPENISKAYKRLATALGKKKVFRESIEKQAREIKRKHESDYRKFGEEYKSGKREKSETVKAAENLIKLLDGTNDAPTSGSQRNNLRDIVYRAIDKFEQQTGERIEPAAFQALIWYPEQDLYKSLGVKLRHVRQDYATSTEQLLNSRGIKRSRIERAKDRVRSRAERGSGDVRSADAVGQGDRRGTGRADSVVPQDENLYDRPAARQIDPAKVEKAVEQNLEDIDKTPGPPVFSVKASPEAQYIGRNPEAALTPLLEDQYFDTPPLSESQQKAVDELTTGPEKSQPNNEILLEVLEGGPIDTFYKRFRARMRLRAIKLRYGGINRHAVFEAISQRVPELREMEADSGAIQALILADRSNAITASAFKDGNVYYRGGGYGVEDFVFEGRKYKGLLEIMSLIYNKDSKDLRKLAQAYAMVQRGEFLSDQGKVVPVTEENKQQILAAVEAVTERNGYNPVTKWHDVWTAYNNKTIDFLKDTGVLSEETADIWRKSSYVPFYRAAQEDDTGLSKATGGIFDDLTKMSYFKEYKGSEKAVDIGLVESVAMNLSAAVNMGMKNVAQQRVARDLQKLGLARQVVAPSKNTITFKVNGRPVHFQIDDGLLYESLQTVDDGATLQRIAYYGGLPATVLREMVTRTPDFILANMFRDTLSTYVTSGGDFTPIVDTVFGFAESMNRLERRGVVGGYDFSIGEQSMKKYFETEAKRRGQSPDGKTLNMFRRLWDGLGMITTKSDAATRNAVYNDVLARTGNDAEATYQAIEIINYARRGAHPAARLLGALIPFLNARFQGIDVFVRAISGDYTTQDNKTRAKIIQRFAARSFTAMALTAIYYMLVSDDDQYKRQSAETKDNNIIIPTSGPVPILLPSPFEVGLLLKTIPEAIIARVMGDRTDREVRDTMIRGVVSTLEVNPLGVQAIAPLAEAAFNHNFFTNRPIVPFYVDKDIVGGFQDNVGTTEFAKFIGQNLPGNFSPMKIDHVIRGYTGTLGGYGVAMIDAVLKSEAVRGDLAAIPPSKSIFQFPLWRRFFGTETGSAQKQVAYEMINEVKSVVRTANMLNKQQRYTEYNRFIEARAPFLAAQDLANEISNELKNMRNEIKAIQAAPMLDEDTKRERIRVIEAQIERYLNYQNPRMRSVIDLPVVDRAY